MTNTITLKDLLQSNGLALSAYEIESEVINLAVNKVNPYYVGTNVKEFLKSLDILDNSVLGGYFPMHDTDECYELGLDFEDAEDNLDYTQPIKVKSEHNTYNWNGNGSNDIHFMELENEFGQTLIALSVHIGTDIRGGYTPFVIINANFDELTDALRENIETVEVDGYRFVGDLLSEWINIDNMETGDYSETYEPLYSSTENGLKEDAREVLKELELI